MIVKNRQHRHLVVFVQIRLLQQVFIKIRERDSPHLRSVFFRSLRFTGSSGGGTSVIGRFGDFVISRLFTNTFSYVSVRFSPRLELDVAVVPGSGSVSPSMS